MADEADTAGLVENEYSHEQQPKREKWQEPYKPEHNNFSIHPFDTADHDPKKWWFACCCPICASFLQRVEFLGENFSRDYYCFQNSLPGCTTINACKMVAEFSHYMPYLCLPLEACCCPGLTFTGNRQIVKDAHNLVDTELERALSITISVASFLGWIGIYWVSCFDACLYVQQQHEFNKRSVDQKGGYKRMEEE
eukprot:CAMPEP_0201523368 /NCGR_PEP_ID=MMETSP0161_2-20130828/19597_1 /ASSEMBLY_ACC=CAM_ASM_000251 /TAXON_ID=180227 /ORGANISM="Neoparamoeba aestuarina, Strain SoJaBio B1-5/56/2" /LENGTH=194 /DNA_ID=CAMNT_0047922467 /DNA_START=130 /DNA_END=714 /DNA_ORIENTATION=+